MEKVLAKIEGIDDEKIDKMMAMGIISLMDVEEVGTNPLVSELGLSEELAKQVVATAGEEGRRLAAEHAAEKAAKAIEDAERVAKAAQDAASGLPPAEEPIGGDGSLDLSAGLAADKSDELDEIASQASRHEEADGDAQVFLHEATEGVNETDAQPVSHRLQPHQQSEDPLGISEYSARSAGGKLEAGEDDIEATRSNQE